jgi:hypothetical protein
MVVQPKLIKFLSLVFNNRFTWYSTVKYINYSDMQNAVE